MRDLSGLIRNKRSFLLINMMMVFIHCIFLVLFFFSHCKIIGYLNILSISIYLFLFLLLQKGHLKTFIYIMIIEIWIHLIFATILCGWETGFVLYNFALAFVIFYFKYIIDDNGHVNHVQISISLVSAFIFLILRFYTFKTEPYYHLSTEILHLFYYVNASIVFLFIIMFMLLYRNVVFMRENSLHEIADYDELTELFNRHKMRDILSKVYEHSLENTHNFCTSIIDIDDFKIINDTYGHEAGDYILKSIALIMRNICSKTPFTFVGRWGGEEFLIVQEYEHQDGMGLNNCINTLRKIHDAIREKDFIYNNNHIQITITAGIAAHPREFSIAATIRVADERLYKGKLNGKDCVCFS